MTAATSENTFTKLLDGACRSHFTNGALAFKVRVMKMLLSMGERDLASTVGRMDLPTRENVTANEARAASQEIV